LQEISITRFAEIGCKYEFQCSLPQWQTETILRDHLQSVGVNIEYGAEVKSIEDDPAGLRVTLEIGGRTESFTPAQSNLAVSSFVSVDTKMSKLAVGSVAEYNFFANRTIREH